MQQGAREPDASVAATIEQELRDGLLSPAVWAAFAERSRAVIVALRDWLDERSSAGGSAVAAYGAAAKGNTLLNAAGVGASEIAVVADGSVAKQGKFLPGTRIPVVAPGELAEANATRHPHPSVEPRRGDRADPRRDRAGRPSLGRRARR